jgi:hypothetical protein
LISGQADLYLQNTRKIRLVVDNYRVCVILAGNYALTCLPTLPAFGGIHAVPSYYLRPFSFAAMFVAVPTLCLALLGCGGGGPPSGTVKGTVTLDGQPVPAGTVMFIPDQSAGMSGPAAQGQLGSDGTFELQGPAGRREVLVGAYIVTVTGPQVSSDSEGSSATSVKLPEKYQYEQSSGITQQVVEGPNQVKIELTSR